MEDDPRKKWWQKISWRWTAGLFLLVILGGSFQIDPTHTGNGPQMNVNGVASWFLLNRDRIFRRTEDRTSSNASGSDYTYSIEPPRQRTVTTGRRSYDYVPPQPTYRSHRLTGPRPQHADNYHEFNDGFVGHFRLSGKLADVGMPGLTPGSHMGLSIEIPGRGDEVGISIHLGEFEIDSTGEFNAWLPQYIQDLDTGRTIDLANRRYDFWLETDEPRFRSCGNWSRYARLIEGDNYYHFLSADRVYCQRTDDVPPL